MDGLINLVNTVGAGDKPKGKQQSWYSFPSEKIGEILYALIL